MKHPKMYVLLICNLPVAIATLLLRRLLAFSEAKLQKMTNIGLILASNVKYHFRFGIST